jgi:hypothetical protein
MNFIYIFFDLNLTDRRFRISIVHVLLFIYSVFSSIIYYFRMHTLVSIVLTHSPNIIQYFRSDYTRKMFSFHGSRSLCVFFFSFLSIISGMISPHLSLTLSFLQLTTNGKESLYTKK